MGLKKPNKLDHKIKTSKTDRSHGFKPYSPLRHKYKTKVRGKEALKMTQVHKRDEKTKIGNQKHT